VENEFKEQSTTERIAYANERYHRAFRVKTDRGRIYITYGPPTKSSRTPQGAPTPRRLEEGGDQTPPTPLSSGAIATWRGSART